MADLFPTKTRLELLRAVRDGRVTQYNAAREGLITLYRASKVDARIAEMEAADWVCLPEGAHPWEGFQWELTDAGRKVLEEADRGR